MNKNKKTFWIRTRNNDQSFSHLWSSCPYSINEILCSHKGIWILDEQQNYFKYLDDKLESSELCSSEILNNLSITEIVSL